MAFIMIPVVDTAAAGLGVGFVAFGDVALPRTSGRRDGASPRHLRRLQGET